MGCVLEMAGCTKMWPLLFCVVLNRHVTFDTCFQFVLAINVMNYSYRVQAHLTLSVLLLLFMLLKQY